MVDVGSAVRLMPLLYCLAVMNTLESTFLSQFAFDRLVKSCFIFVISGAYIPLLPTLSDFSKEQGEKCSNMSFTYYVTKLLDGDVLPFDYRQLSQKMSFLTVDYDVRKCVRA